MTVLLRAFVRRRLLPEPLRKRRYNDQDGRLERTGPGAIRGCGRLYGSGRQDGTRCSVRTCARDDRAEGLGARCDRRRDSSRSAVDPCGKRRRRQRSARERAGRSLHRPIDARRRRRSKRWPRASKRLQRSPIPVGEITDLTFRPTGIQVGRMRVPLGVVGHHLRIASERHRRRRGAVPQVGQCDDPARRLGGDPEQSRRSPLACTMACARRGFRRTPCRSSRRPIAPQSAT